MLPLSDLPKATYLETDVDGLRPGLSGGSSAWASTSKMVRCFSPCFWHYHLAPVAMMRKSKFTDLF